MKIDSADIQFSSQHLALQQHTVKESLRFQISNPRPLNAPQDKVTLSDEAKASDKAETADNTLDPQLRLIKSFIEALTGHKIKLFSMSDIHSDAPPSDPKDPRQAQTQPTREQSDGFSLEYHRSETVYESEQTSFSAQGTIKTVDGNEIGFNLELNMNREYFRQTNVDILMGDAAKQKKDPLVINFSGTAAQLTDTKFSFDIDSDGQADQVSFVSPGSGFLALDRNRDGKINNGIELFGAATGNGFQELAAYDTDRNHFIDENDAIYSKLSILSKDASGKDALNSLASKGVGAIFLGNVATPFEIKNSQNESNGQVRSSGVYLNENGTVGTVQQVDLSV